MADPRNYPILTATLLAPIVAYVGGKVGLNLSDAEAAGLAGVILTAGSFLATASTRSRRTLPDPDATRSNSAVEVRPTTHRIRDDAELPEQDLGLRVDRPRREPRRLVE